MPRMSSVKTLFEETDAKLSQLNAENAICKKREGQMLLGWIAGGVLLVLGLAVGATFVVLGGCALLFGSGATVMAYAMRGVSVCNEAMGVRRRRINVLKTELEKGA